MNNDNNNEIIYGVCTTCNTLHVFFTEDDYNKQCVYCRDGIVVLTETLCDIANDYKNIKEELDWALKELGYIF